MIPQFHTLDHPARILIVDDEPHNRQLLEVLLGSEHYALETANSGEAALASVAQQPPDLILLDIMMPGMNGFDVALQIKGNPVVKNIPIIMVTALDDREAKIRGLEVGAVDFLSKPVDRIELCARVRNLLCLKAYGDSFDRYSRTLEAQVVSSAAVLAERTEQAALLAEQAALLDLAQDAIIVRDISNHILFWSRGAEVMYGWLAKDAWSKNMCELLKAQYSMPIESIEIDLLRNGKWEGEAVHCRRDGARLTVSSRWSLQRDAKGQPNRILTLNSDVTERREAEAALDRGRVEQLRFKDEFLSHVSHELRSPLTAIKQFTTILLSGIGGELNKEQREYEEIVLKNIGQLQSMIDDLIEVTRLETGKFAISLESVSVSAAVADIVDTLDVIARAKGITLSFNIPPGLPSALADPTRLRQILIILLDNAIKFTPENGSIRIHAQLQQDQKCLQVEVEDTGCGIRSEIADKIFDRLFQVIDPNQGSRKGLGLGLYICKELVMQQGGEIWVKAPKKPTGATLSFTLPVSCQTNGTGLITN